jgi:hypothetical protein
MKIFKFFLFLLVVVVGDAKSEFEAELEFEAGFEEVETALDLLRFNLDGESDLDLEFLGEKGELRIS